MNSYQEMSGASSGAGVCWSCEERLPENAAYCPGCGQRQSDRSNSALWVVDASTGLFNSVFLRAIAEHEVTRGVRHRRPLAAAVVEIDQAEMVASDLGPRLEVVLAALAKVLNAVVRDTDTVGILRRYAPPRFAIILPETDLEGAIQTCDKVRLAAAAHEFQDAGQWRRLTVSCAVAALNWERLEQADLVDQAREALAEGRQAGPNRTHVAVRTLI